jgi:hypothetical protein
MHRQITVPHEFKLNGANPQEQAERDRKVGTQGKDLLLQTLRSSSLPVLDLPVDSSQPPRP